MSLPQYNKNSNGHTLIELILVIVFLSVAILSTMNMMTGSLVGSINIELMSTATNLANEKMEMVFADKKSKGYGYVVSNNYQDEVNVNGLNGFSRFVTVTVYSTYKQVVVKVSHAGIEDCLMTAFITNY